MKFFKNNTSNLFRVFFILFVISLATIAFKHNKKISAEIKSLGGSLHEGMVGAPRFINPVLAQSQTDSDITRLLFTPLISIEDEGEIEYRLVESIEKSKDNLVYTLRLKPGIVFEDGTLLNADDVLFTIDSIKDPLIKSPLAQKWQGVEVAKVDHLTLTFTLARPYHDFLYNFDLGILPKHIWKDINPQEFIYSTYNTSPVGNGPYTVKEIKNKDTGIPSEYHLLRSRNSEESVYIQNMIIHFFDNESDLIKALNKGVIEAAYGISPNYIGEVRDRYHVYSASLPRVFALFFNQNKQTLLQSQKVRQAISYSIDKESLVNSVFNGYASPINSIIGDKDRDLQYNPKKASQLLASDGWVRNDQGIYTKLVAGKLATLGFTISIPNVDDIRKVAEVIKADLETAGILVTIKSFDTGNFMQSVLRPRDYESIIYGYEIERPSDLYDYWHSSRMSDPGFNISMYKNDAADTLLQNMRAQEVRSLDPLDTLINESYPAVFLYTPSYIYLLPEKVRDATFAIKKSSDRYNTIENWFIKTRHVWKIFIDDTHNNE